VLLCTKVTSHNYQLLFSESNFFTSHLSQLKSLITTLDLDLEGNKHNGPKQFHHSIYCLTKQDAHFVIHYHVNYVYSVYLHKFLHAKSKPTLFQVCPCIRQNQRRYLHWVAWYVCMCVCVCVCVCIGEGGGVLCVCVCVCVCLSVRVRVYILRDVYLRV
jgi:hypothetical protein